MTELRGRGLLRPSWSTPPPVHAWLTTRDLPGVSRPPFERGNLGDRCGDDPQDVAANRRMLIDEAGLPAAPHWLRQVHGVAVQVVEDDASGDIAQADASYTRTPNAVLAVLTADCLPLLLCNAEGTEVAAVHAGWRGLAAGVIEAAVAQFRSPAHALSVWLGPAIGAKSYEIGEEVRAAFVDRSASAHTCFAPTRPGHWHCDLYALARQRLTALGVENVAGGGYDTYTDVRFYSHRRERIGGRFASLIWIDGGAGA